MELSADEKARQVYEARIKEQRDIRTREQGAVKQNSLNIALKLLQRNRPIDEIVEDTGLTHAEIESLRNVNWFYLLILSLVLKTARAFYPDE